MKKMISKIKIALKDIWLGFALSNEFRNNYQQWPKI